MFRQQGLQHGIDWKVNLGVAVLGMVLIISTLAVLAFLVIPLAVGTGGAQSRAVSLLYFIAVGLGYILVEIAFIQRFVLFLGHPTYALTVVIFLMMLSSGAGSLLSRMWLPHTKLAWIPLALVIITLLADVFFLPNSLASLVGMAFGYRLVVSAVILIPLGFVMGMPFPTGLRALAAVDSQGNGTSPSSENLVEWAWAMNAAASVMGSVLAMVIAIQFGLTITLTCGAAAYLCALLLTATLPAKVSA
jgi:hypothetical protein